ncbi:hypothetical protein M3Y97_00018600 [Aphelenchoides bicaudatus]|nr:hypothetical protein M3Y97_00018600 [Aphelenchoides bicaudatus]
MKCKISNPLGPLTFSANNKFDGSIACRNCHSILFLSNYAIKKRQERKKCLTSSVNTSKTGSGASDETSGGGTHWSPTYNSAMNLAMPSVEYSNSGPLGQSKLIARLYGSSSSNNLFHAQPILATANTKQGALIRTLPKRMLPHQISTQNAPIRLHLQQQFPSQYCVHHQPATYSEHPASYCTLNNQHQPQYEEIGSICQQYGTHYSANPICFETIGHPVLQRHDSGTIFEDLSENIRRQERRPPPNTRPPAPPTSKYQQVSQKPTPHSRQSNSDSSITDELGSASDVELEHLAQLGVPLEVLHARQQSANDLLHGRESGYGTGSKARVNKQWHSPPQMLRTGSSVRSPLQSSSGHSSQHNSPPSAVPTPPVRLLKTHTNNNNSDINSASEHDLCLNALKNLCSFGLFNCINF